MKHTREEANKRLLSWLNGKHYTKTEVAELLNISRMTLHRRLKNKDWRAKEVVLIFKHMPF